MLCIHTSIHQRFSPILYVATADRVLNSNESDISDIEFLFSCLSSFPFDSHHYSLVWFAAMHNNTENKIFEMETKKNVRTHFVRRRERMRQKLFLSPLHAKTHILAYPYFKSIYLILSYRIHDFPRNVSWIMTMAKG